MFLGYVARLLVFCGAVFFAVQAFAATLVGLLTPAIVGRAERLTPGRATRELLAWRFAPALLAALAALGLCLPNYLWFEPRGGLERIGWPVLGAALLAAQCLAGSLWRLARVLSAARRQAAWGRREGRAWRPAGGGMRALRLAVPGPILAVHGFRRPQLWISDRVLADLRGDQLAAALRHEHAHARRRDNLARLLLRVLPHWLPGRAVSPKLQVAWERLTEWAADDEAAGGSRRRGLALAAALVRVARLGNSPEAACAHPLVGAAICDLESRVRRLTRPAAPAAPAATSVPWLTMGAMLALVAVLALPATQQALHALLEVLAR